MFRGAGVFTCAFIHATFNFCGNIISNVRGLGFGAFSDVWCWQEILLTAVVGVAAIVYFVWLLYTSKPDVAEKFAVYPPQKTEKPCEGSEENTLTNAGESENAGMSTETDAHKKADNSSENADCTLCEHSGSESDKEKDADKRENTRFLISVNNTGGGVNTAPPRLFLLCKPIQSRRNNFYTNNEFRFA